MKTPYALDDPTVQKLAAFLGRTPLSNGRGAPMPIQIRDYVAQSICNYFVGLVWSDGEWVELTQWERIPDLGDVGVKIVGDPQGEHVFRVEHRTTGAVAFGDTPAAAMSALKKEAQRA